MVLEILLSAILTTSIAGAGLLIAIYTLIAQLRNRLFEKRLAALKEKEAEFEKTKKSITPEEATRGSEQLKEIGYDIRSMRAFPTYLSSVGGVFAGYILSAFISLFWLTDTVQNPITGTEEVVQNSVAEFFLIAIFFLTTFAFFVVVLLAVKDVHELMKADFESLKDEQEKADKARMGFAEALKRAQETKEKVQSKADKTK